MTFRFPSNIKALSFLMVKAQELISARPILPKVLSIHLHSQTGRWGTWSWGWGHRTAEAGSRVFLESTLGAREGECKLVILFRLLGSSGKGVHLVIQKITSYKRVWESKELCGLANGSWQCEWENFPSEGFYLCLMSAKHLRILISKLFMPLQRLILLFSRSM